MPREETQRVYPLNGGHNDSLPPWGIRPDQLANAKNMRTWRGELRTGKGYASSTSSVIRTGVTSIQGLGWGVRADGTEDLIAASDGGYWKLVGDVKTLLSVSPARGLVTSVSGTAVVADSDARLTVDYHVGDLFWITTDGIAEAVAVTSIESLTGMTLAGAYGGATTAGAHSGWWKQTDAATRMAFWNNKWFFANGTDRLKEWDAAEFRESGGPEPPKPPYIASVATASGGSLTADVTFYYRFCLEDADGMYTVPTPPHNVAGFSIDVGGTTNATAKKLVLTPVGATTWAEVTAYQEQSAWTAWPEWFTKLRIYRRTAASGTYYFHSSIAASTTAWEDDGTTVLSTTDTLPAYNIRGGAGFEDIAVYDNRLCAVSGRYLHISGLPATDPHTLLAGRLEPEYWNVAHRVGDGEETDTLALLVMRNNLYLPGSQHLWAVDRTGDDPAVWGVYKFLPNVGCVSRDAIGRTGRFAVWLGRLNGRLTVISFDGRTAQDIGRPIRGILDGIDATKYAEVVGGVAHGYYFLTIPGSTYKTLQLDLETMTWSWRDWQIQAFAQGNAEGYMALQDGVVYKSESGYAKGAAAQAYSVDTAGFDLGVPEYPKRFHSLQAEFDVYAGAPVVSAYYSVDDGAFTALAESPVAVSARPIFRTGLPTAAYGQRIQFRFAFTHSGVDVALRGITVKGEIEERDVD